MPSTTFADYALPPLLLDRIAALGFKAPTDIQAAAIPVLLEGRDVVGIAQTGTGKTAAFGLPIAASLDPDVHEVQALILAPTRELALQSAEAMKTFGADTVAVYGGTPYGPQIGALKHGAQVVVGTPGRVIDLIDKRALRLDAVRFFVLDEADEMLRMGFAEDVEQIASSLPKDRLTALFSATMPAGISRVAQTHLRDPLRLEVSAQASTVDTIHQTYAVIPRQHRFDALTRVLATHEGGTIVFVRTRQEAEDISLDLAAAGFKAAGISGDVPQRDREKLVERLRSGALDVLVATDVAARGLDVDRISLVVNYEVPRETEAYVHRVGRTGRAGRDGVALTFFGPRERFRLGQIEKLTGSRMEKISVPSQEDVVRFVARRKLQADIEIRSRRVLREALMEAVERGESVEEIALRLLAEATGVADSNDFESADWDQGGKGGKKRGAAGKSGRGNRSHGSFAHRYRVEVGKRDGVSPGAIVGALTGEADISGSQVGKVAIYPSFSLVELSEPLHPGQIKKIARSSVRGRKLRISADRGSSAKARYNRHQDR